MVISKTCKEHGLVDWLRTSPWTDGLQRQFGAWAEELWSAIFYVNGLRSISLCKINERGRAPMQNGPYKTVLTDYEISSTVFSIYADSKAKRGPVLWEKGLEFRHGIDKRNYEEYVTLSEANRKNACLLIFEAFTNEKDLQYWSGALLVQSLSKLRKPIRGFNTCEHMVFWPKRDFVQIGSLQPEEALDLVNKARATPLFKEQLWDVLEIAAQAPVQRRLW